MSNLEALRAECHIVPNPVCNCKKGRCYRVDLRQEGAAWRVAVRIVGGKVVNARVFRSSHGSSGVETRQYTLCTSSKAFEGDLGRVDAGRTPELHRILTLLEGSVAVRESVGGRTVRYDPLRA